MLRLGVLSRIDFRRLPWLQTLIILAVIWLSASPTGWIGFIRVLLLFGGIALIISLMTLRHLPLFLTFMVATAGTIDIAIRTGTDSPVTVAILMTIFLCAVWLVRMLLFERRVSLAATQLNLPWILFLVSALISWIASSATLGWGVKLPGNILVVQAGQYAMFALSAAAFWLTANHALPEKQLQLWTALIIGMGMARFAYNVLLGRDFPLEYVHGSLLMWPVALIVGQLLFNPRLQARTRLTFFLCLGLWAIWVLKWSNTFKGGWVPAVLAISLLIFLKKPRLGILLGLGAAFILLRTNYLDTFFQGEDASLLRPYIWWDVIRMGARSLLLGLGPATYMYTWGDPSFTSITFQRMRTYAWDQFNFAPPSHNIYVDIFAQTGILGLFFFLWVLVAAVRLGWRLHKRLEPGFQKAYAEGVFAGFFAIAVSSAPFADWLIPFVYNIGIDGFSHSVYSWLLLGTLVTLENSLADSKQDESKPQPIG